MKVCTACGKDFGEDSNHLDVVEDKNGVKRKRCPDTNKFARLESPQTYEDPYTMDDFGASGTGGPQGGVALDRASRCIIEKADFVRKWLESGPIGIDPESKGTQYLLEKLDRDPEITQDVEKLKYWVRDMTEVKDIALDEMEKKLNEIEKDYKAMSPPPTSRNRDMQRGESEGGQPSRARQESDRANEMEKMAKAKFFQKAEGVLDKVEPMVTMAEIIGEEARRDPEIREALKDIIGVKGLAKILKKTAEKKGNTDITGEPKRTHGPSYDEMGYEEQLAREEGEQKKKSPDERVQEAIDAVEEKAKKEGLDTPSDEEYKEEEVLEGIE